MKVGDKLPYWVEPTKAINRLWIPFQTRSLQRTVLKISDKNAYSPEPHKVFRWFGDEGNSQVIEFDSGVLETLCFITKTKTKTKDTYIIGLKDLNGKSISIQVKDCRIYVNDQPLDVIIPDKTQLIKCRLYNTSNYLFCDIFNEYGIELTNMTFPINNPKTLVNTTNNTKIMFVRNVSLERLYYDVDFEDGNDLFVTIENRHYFGISRDVFCQSIPLPLTIKEPISVEVYDIEVI